MTLLQKLFQHQNDRKVENQSRLTLLVPSHLKFILLACSISFSNSAYSYIWYLGTPPKGGPTPELGCIAYGQQFFGAGGYGCLSPETPPRCSYGSTETGICPLIWTANTRNVYSIEITQCPSGYIGNASDQCVKNTLEKDRKQPHDICGTKEMQSNDVFRAIGLSRYDVDIQCRSI